MARPDPSSNDITLGRGFAGAAVSFSSNGTATSYYFRCPPAATQITFACCRPNHAGTWVPNWVDDTGALVPLTTAISISTNASGITTLPVSGDLFCITYTNTDSNAGTVGSFYMACGGAT